jgi:soluble lytic murein transglycosylase
MIWRWMLKLNTRLLKTIPGLGMLFIGLILAACSPNRVLPLAATPTALTSPFPTQGLFTAVPTAAPTPIPTPTPIPAARISSGDHAMFNGDWETALKEYGAASASSDLEVQAAAALGLGRAYYATKDYARALLALRSLVENYPDSPHLPAGQFLLGQTYTALARHADAVEAYSAYLALRPGLIDAYVLEMSGDARYALREYAAALDDFSRALQQPRAGSRIPLQIKTARAYAQVGEYATALVMYQDIYNRSTNDYTRAQVNLLMGQIYLSLGETSKAHAAFADSVEKYPVANDTLQGLIVLVEAGYPVNELDRGLVNYYARQHNLAVAAFDRYLASEPEDPAAAHYFKGMSLRALGSASAAIEQWDLVIGQYPASTWWGNAWEQKAAALSQDFKSFEDSKEVVLTFVQTSPWHPKAAEMLFRTAREAEIQGDLAEAAALWERLGVDLPASQQAFQAMYLSGICRYRLADFPAARDAFLRAAGLSTTPSQTASANLWLGKVQDSLGDPDSARTFWQQAAAADPTGYYSERARDLLANRQPFTRPVSIDLGYDRPAEMAQAEAWLRDTFRLPPEISLSGPGPLLADQRLQRGTELWNLGLFRQARDEFEELRTAYEHDPVGTYRLANYYQEIGLYRSSVLAARRVLTLAGLDDASTLNAPMHFNRIRFGAYYADLLLPLAQEYDFHPFLMWSVMRQESFFEPFIGSSAGARGLMQFMPATGQERAERLSWPPNYTADDLDRPIVSITFGASYLDFTRKYLDGDLYGTLAAYNGGPGNARAWKDLAGNDPDLYLEVVRFEETRRYIRAISEMYAIYVRLFSIIP